MANRYARLPVAVAIAALVCLPAVAWAEPSNDNLANAQPLGPALPTGAVGTNFDAGREEPVEPSHAGETETFASVWYRWTPDANVAAVVETDVCDPEGFEGPDLLAVYAGDDYADPLDELGSDAGSCINKVPFNAVAGQPYSIAVAGSVAEDATTLVGDFTIRIRAQGAPPANDAFEAASPLSGPPGIAVTGTTLDATKQAGEPGHAGNPGGASVWYRWTAPAAEAVTISTCGSTFDSLLAVYSGSTLGGLVPTAANDDSCGGLGDKLSLTTVAGRSYAIAVDGYKGDEGNFTLRIVGDGGGGGGGSSSGAVEGKQFGAENISGKVRIKRPGERSYSRLRAGDAVTVGALLDTRNGKVTLVSSYNGVLERVAISAGVTRVTQRRGSKPYLVASLEGPLSCTKGATVAKKKRKKGKGRRLWADGKGHFKTRGRQASATVRGTKWLTYDRCDGSTLIWARRDTVVVKPKGKRRVVINSEGRSRYVARP